MARRNPNPLRERMRERIRQSRGNVVFLRRDFADLGGYDQVGRALKSLIDEGELARIGYGLYARTKVSVITGELRPAAPLPELAREALSRLGVEVVPSRMQKAYNEGRSTQVPTGRRIGVRSRVQRRISNGGVSVTYEYITDEAAPRRTRKSVRDRMCERIRQSQDNVFFRNDFADLGGYDQVGRALKGLISKGELVRIGYGLYARADINPLTGTVQPVLPLPELAREALSRLGVEIKPTRMERAYNEGRSTQVPTGRRIGVRSRCTRRIGYDGMYVSYEYVSRSSSA